MDLRNLFSPLTTSAKPPWLPLTLQDQASTTRPVWPSWRSWTRRRGCCCRASPRAAPGPTPPCRPGPAGRRRGTARSSSTSPRSRRPPCSTHTSTRPASSSRRTPRSGTSSSRCSPDWRPTCDPAHPGGRYTTPLHEVLSCFFSLLCDGPN